MIIINWHFRTKWFKNIYSKHYGWFQEVINSPWREIKAVICVCVCVCPLTRYKGTFTKSSSWGSKLKFTALLASPRLDTSCSSTVPALPHTLISTELCGATRGQMGPGGGLWLPPGPPASADALMPGWLGEIPKHTRAHTEACTDTRPARRQLLRMKSRVRCERTAAPALEHEATQRQGPR